MAKSQGKDEKDEKEKDRKRKDRKALVGRVKKVVKKSRRKLGEEKFEKELQRTITFLERLQHTLVHSRQDGASSAKPKPTAKAAKPAANRGAAQMKK